jgi:hypothetical protein
VRPMQDMEVSEDSILVLGKFLTSFVGVTDGKDRLRPFVKIVLTGFSGKGLVSEKNKNSPKNPREAQSFDTGPKTLALLVKKFKEKLAKIFKRLYGFS